MANTFKNYTAQNVGAANTIAYTVPVDTTSVVTGINVANTVEEQILVDIQIAGVYLVKGAPIPVGSSLSPLDGKIIIETGDTIVVKSDQGASCDVLLSVLEQT